MMQPWQVVHGLKQISGNERLNLLRKLDAESEFWKGCHLAYDPYVTFGIRKLPDQASPGPGVSFREFADLADRLARRAETGLSGHAARDAVQAFADRCTEHQWEWWYKRLLARELDCGTSIDTINKVAPPHLVVAKYQVALAHPIRKTSPKNIPDDAYYEAKYDGYRITWRVTRDDCRALSRNGLEKRNFTVIADQMRQLVDVPGFPDSGLLIDSEVISDSFNSVQAHAERITEESTFDGLAACFDVLPLDVFDAQGPSAPLRDRRRVLEDIMGYFGELMIGRHGVNKTFLSHCQKDMNPRAELVAGSKPLEFVEDGSLMRFFQEQIEAKHEGMMVKDARAPYVYDRHPCMLKLKPRETLDFKILGYYEGKGKRAGQLGGLDIQLVVKGKEVRTKMGSGFSDQQLRALWEQRLNLPGMTGEAMTDGITTNKQGTASLRFPVFKKLRDDK